MYWDIIDTETYVKPCFLCSRRTHYMIKLHGTINHQDIWICILCSRGLYDATNNIRDIDDGKPIPDDFTTTLVDKLE